MTQDDPSTTFTGSVFIATSLDGFIARPNGDIDWLMENGDPGDTGYVNFMSEIDLLVVGRGTYEKALTFDSWPYVGRRVLLLSKSTKTSSDDRVELHNSLDTLVKAIEASNAHRVYIDGGKVVQTFLKAGLVQELTITQVPILLGHALRTDRARYSTCSRVNESALGGICPNHLHGRCIPVLINEGF